MFKIDFGGSDSMTNDQPQHSLMLFTQKIDDALSNYLIEHIKQGIKLYLFTTDFLENYETNQTWEEAKYYHIFYWEKIPFHEDLPQYTVSFVDGVITNKWLYEYICNNSSFNHEQYSIEHAKKDAHLMISAGAGTGKTTIMINRLLFLKHTTPSLSLAQVVMITFTNEAAVQMRQKFTSLLMNYYQVTKKKCYLEWMEEAQRLQISTLHSFAKKFLESAGQELGFSSSFSIRSFRFNKIEIIKKWINEYALNYPEEFRPFMQFPQYLLVNTVLFVNSTLENKSLSRDQIANQLDLGDDNKKLARLLQFLLHRLQIDLLKIMEEENKCEMTDLISELQNLQGTYNLKEVMDIKYLMVDEFQDTDIVQVKFLLWLRQHLHFQLFIVGDVKQSIYRFRGADYTAFQQLEEGLFKQGQQIFKKSLVKNYRSTAQLLNQLNPLFTEWSKDISKFNYGNSDRLKPVFSSNQDNDGFETYVTKAKLKDIIFKKLFGSEIAILVRSNEDVQEMITWCQENGIPCEGTVKGDFYRSIAVREFYQLIRGLINIRSTTDQYALHRSSYGDNTLSNHELLQQFTPEKKVNQELIQAQPDWNRWEKFRELIATQPVLEVINKIITDTKPDQVYARRQYHKMKAFYPNQSPDFLQQETRTLKMEYRLNLDHLLYLLQKTFSDTVLTLHGMEKFIRLHMQTDAQEPLQTAPQENREHRIKCMTVHKV